MVIVETVMMFYLYLDVIRISHTPYDSLRLGLEPPLCLLLVGGEKLLFFTDRWRAERERGHAADKVKDGPLVNLALEYS